MFNESYPYVLKGLESFLSLLSIKDAVPIFIELLSNNVVLPADISVSINVITDVWSSLGMSLLRKFCASLLLFLCHAWSRPPLRDVDVFSQDVAAIITRLLFDLEIPSENVNPWRLMLGRIKL